MKRATDITGVILAGGRNSRIQREKAFLPVGGVPIIDRQVTLLQQHFRDVCIVTAKPQIRARFPGLQFAQDQFAEMGPAAGIHAALKACRNKAVFVVACDMPCLNSQLINRMIAVYRQTGAQIVIPRHQKGIEPLHALYGADCLAPLQQQLQQGVCQVRHFFVGMDVCYVDVSQEDSTAFHNINTQWDLQASWPETGE